MTRSIFSIVKEYSEKIKDGRTRNDILIHTMEEVGELATECKIADGRSYKTAGPDGIVGEATDAILCNFDQIFVETPGITEEEFNAIALAKCEKWFQKVMG